MIKIKNGFRLNQSLHQKSTSFSDFLLKVFFCLSGILLLTAIPANSSPWPEVINEHFYEVGFASYYGQKFQGQRTASGEGYNMHAMTAAHPDLEFGSWVEVTNLNNDRKVMVRINDRGPFMKGRIIDLSYAAAKKLGLLSQGVAKVSVCVISRREGEENLLSS